MFCSSWVPFSVETGELYRADGRESLKTGHGFYVYRGGRLVVPGGWFRIVPSDELIRLARVRVDVPVELDHLWKVDIRNTMAEPPAALRPELKRIVGAVTIRSVGFTPLDCARLLPRTASPAGRTPPTARH